MRVSVSLCEREENILFQLSHTVDSETFNVFSIVCHHFLLLFLLLLPQEGGGGDTLNFTLTHTHTYVSVEYNLLLLFLFFSRISCCVMADVSDEGSITAEWLETILQLFYNSNGGSLLDGPSRDEEDDDDDENNDGQAIATAVAIQSIPVPMTPSVQVRVKQFQVRPGCEEGENLLSDLLAIDVQLYHSRDGGEEEDIEEGEQQLHLMAKLLSQDPFCRHFILEAGFDVREIHFYTTLLPALQQFCIAQGDSSGGGEGLPWWPVPPCFYAKYRQGSDSVLVLENMKSSGYAVQDFTRGLSLAQAKAAVQSIARIHASALVYRIKLDVDLGQAFPFLFRPEAAAESYQQLLERGLPQLASFLHTSAADLPELHAVLAKLHKLRPRARETIANLLRPASAIATLTHTDFWCNNLLFRSSASSDAVECSVIDWQMATYSRPTNDLALLLVTSVSGEVRRNETPVILDAYWTSFCRTAANLGLDVEGQLNFNRRDLDVEYQQSLLLAVLLGIGSVDLAIGHEATEKRLCQVLVDLSDEKVF